MESLGYEYTRIKRNGRGQNICNILTPENSRPLNRTQHVWTGKIHGKGKLRALKFLCSEIT